MKPGRAALFMTRVRDRTWLSERAFQIELDRPSGFQFLPGQSITFVNGTVERDYSLACAPDSARLIVCIRLVRHGLLSPFLAAAPPGTVLAFSGPHGYFLFQPSIRPAVFVATGTGVAPFSAMADSGVRGFTMIHGARTANELYYGTRLRAASAGYAPCVTEGEAAGCFTGRVSDWAREHLTPRAYDFYLCGSREMIRDVTLLVDEMFSGSRVLTEIFH